MLAASTHPGEEALIAERGPRAAPAAPLLIIAPRHPERGGEIAADLAQRGLRRRAAHGAAGRSGDVDVYLADTLGELGLFFRLADVAVMGGGFVAGVGGHNPLEPARLGVGVVSGPHVVNFADIYRRDGRGRRRAAWSMTPARLDALGEPVATAAPALALGERAHAYRRRARTRALDAALARCSRRCCLP